MHVIASALLVLVFLAGIACSGRPQRTPADPPPADSGQWQPVGSVPGGFRRNLVGDPRQPGPYKYQLKLPAGSRLAAHQHSIEVRVKVLSGSMFIIIGEPLESSRAQRFEAGSVLVVPARTWHDEWWDEETALEAEGVGPLETIYRSQ